jgi:hypothetical protein
MWKPSRDPGRVVQGGTVRRQRLPAEADLPAGEVDVDRGDAHDQRRVAARSGGAFPECEVHMRLVRRLVPREAQELQPGPAEPLEPGTAAVRGVSGTAAAGVVTGLGEQGAPPAPVRPGHRDPLAEHRSGRRERLSVAGRDEVGDPLGGQFHEQCPAAAVERGEEPSVQPDARQPVIVERRTAGSAYIGSTSSQNNSSPATGMVVSLGRSRRRSSGTIRHRVRSRRDREFIGPAERPQSAPRMF